MVRSPIALEGLNVTHITSEEMANLPDDPEQAFIALERIVRARYKQEFHQTNSDAVVNTRRQQYMLIVLPAAKHFKIFNDLSFTDGIKIDRLWEIFDQFVAEVDYRVTELRLQNIEHERLYSVALDEPAKVRLRSLLAQIRETVDAMEISVAKKERLFARINALQEEIDRDRTRYQAFAAFLAEATDDVGEAAKRLEPVVRLGERLLSAIGGAKREEDKQRQLPPPAKKPKQIENKAKSSFDKELDDETPF